MGTEFPTASCPPSPTSIRSTMPPTRPSLLINPMVSPKRPTISSLACSKSDVEKVSNTEKTTCKCGGDTKVCGCAPGKCSCSDCPKAETEPVAGTDKTTCKCGGDDKNCPCEAGKCAFSGCSK